MEQWKEDRINFYMKSGALDFIKDFFEVKEGIRCVIGHEKDYKYPTYYKYGDNVCKMMTLPDNDDGSYSALRDFYCVHFPVYIFNKEVLHWMNMESHIDIIEKSRIGMNAVIELDAPYDLSSDRAKRVNFFDFISEFNKTLKIIDKELEEINTEYNLLFSGNGVYVILEGVYPSDYNNDAELLWDYIDNLLDFGDSICDKYDMKNDLKVHMDWTETIPWNDYFKIPFTFHEKRPRITVPISKSEIDEKWLDYVSNVDNVINDLSIVSEVIKKCEWKKIW